MSATSPDLGARRRGRRAIGQSGCVRERALGGSYAAPLRRVGLFAVENLDLAADRRVGRGQAAKLPARVPEGAWSAPPHAAEAAPLAGALVRFRGYPGSRAEARGYTRAELSAVSELGFHYLVNGGLQLSRALFSGLVELLPGEPYFHLALGLTRDHLEDRPGAMRSYTRAAQLDAPDPRPDINRAELCILEGERGAAQAFLRSGLKKALACGDAELGDKAAALLSRLTEVGS